VYSFVLDNMFHVGFLFQLIEIYSEWNTELEFLSNDSQHFLVCFKLDKSTVQVKVFDGKLLQSSDHYNITVIL